MQNSICRLKVGSVAVTCLLLGTCMPNAYGKQCVTVPSTTTADNTGSQTNFEYTDWLELDTQSVPCDEPCQKTVTLAAVEKTDSLKRTQNKDFSFTLSSLFKLIGGTAAPKSASEENSTVKVTWPSQNETLATGRKVIRLLGTETIDRKETRKNGNEEGNRTYLKISHKMKTVTGGINETYDPCTDTWTENPCPE
jgi:hypothetical protein